VRRLGELAAVCKQSGASLTELGSGSRRGTVTGRTRLSLSCYSQFPPRSRVFRR
jgi:hypothetical protein